MRRRVAVLGCTGSIGLSTLDLMDHADRSGGADIEVTALVDEPSAAAKVLSISDGAVVDIGGGTTGISVIRDGEPIYTADEATGGTHVDLVAVLAAGPLIELFGALVDGRSGLVLVA